MKILKEKTVYLFLIITLLYFGMFISLELAADTYCVFTAATKYYAQHFLQSGRFVSAFFLCFIRFFNFSNNVLYYISFIIGIISTTLSMYFLNNIISNKINNKLLSILLSVLIVICPFSIELFLFLEKGIMMLSVLLEILAFKYFSEYMKNYDKKYIFIVLLLMILASFSYQGTIGLFVTLGCLVIIEKSNSIKSFIKNNIILALLYGLPAALNYLIVRCMFKNSRVSSPIIIKESLKKIFENIINMLRDTYQILPKYFFITFGIILLLLVLYLILKNKKFKVINILKLFYIITINFLVIIMPQIMQGTDSIGFAPRNTYPFASILGILILFAFYIKIMDKKYIKLIIIIIILFLGVQYVSFNKIEKDRYILNYMDKYNANLVLKKVTNYENNTGNYVKKVAFYNDEIQYTYPNLFVSGDINIKATYPEWCRTDYLSYYLNRKLTEVKFDNKVYENYFKNKEWISFDLEQVIIINDTIYIYLY